MSVQIQKLHECLDTEVTCERPDTEVTCECLDTEVRYECSDTEVSSELAGLLVSKQQRTNAFHTQTETAGQNAH